MGWNSFPPWNGLLRVRAAEEWRYLLGNSGYTGEFHTIKDWSYRSEAMAGPGYFAVEPVKDLNLSSAEAAWWQVGEVAYAVVSSTPGIGLSDEAELLKSSLY